MNASRMTVLVLFLFLYPAALLGSSAVPRVENPAQPAQGVQKIELEELWRVGGEDDEENIFGVVNRALVDEENNIFLLDA